MYFVDLFVQLGGRLAKLQHALVAPPMYIILLSVDNSVVYDCHD